MTDNTYTDITIVLDRSGSMGIIAKDMEGGIKRFIEEQRKVPGTCLLSVLQFDTVSTEWSIKAQDIQNTPEIQLMARGGTPLLDAVGRAVVQTGERLATLPEQQRPGKVIVLVVTDGQENSSQEFGREQVQKLVAKQEQKYGWAFLYLGANVDAFAEARGLGMPIVSSTPYSPTPDSVRAVFSVAAQKVATYRGSGNKDDLAYTDQERDNIQKGTN